MQATIVHRTSAHKSRWIHKVMEKQRDHTATVVAAVVAMVAIGVALVVGLEAVHSDETTGLVTMIVIGFIGTNITALLAILRTEQGNKKVDNVAKSMNGDLDRRIEKHIKAGQDDLINRLAREGYIDRRKEVRR